MSVPAIINFKGLDSKKEFGRGTKEYNALKAVNGTGDTQAYGDWKDYCNDMLKNSVVVVYDPTFDVFCVKPIDSYELNEEMDYEDEVEGDDIDAESDSDFLSNLMNDIETGLNGADDEEEVEDAPEPTTQFDVVGMEQPETQPIENNNSMNVVSLDDVLAIINQLGLGPTEEEETTSTNTSNILDSEFDSAMAEIGNFEDHVNDTSYINVINGTTKNGTGEYGATNPANVKSKLDGVGNNIPPAKVDQSQDFDCDYSDPLRLVADLPQSAGFDPNDEEMIDGDQLLLDSDDSLDSEEETIEESDFLGHPDLQRMGMEGLQEEEEEDDFETIDVPEEGFEAETETLPAVIPDTNKTVSLGGKSVKLVLTGIMITSDELGMIGEKLGKFGAQLKEVRGSNQTLNIIMESEGKQYTINYFDKPATDFGMPFSVKKLKFRTIEEALERIHRKQSIKESEIFSKIINEDITKRSLNDHKSANILEGFENANAPATWNIYTVGTLNLKTGLNETYSYIQDHGKEPNTLVKTANGTYYMIKGNLRESSKVGTKRELVDVKRKINYGIAEVVGVYDNTPYGLGDAMMEIKKTSVPLLVWK